MAEKSFLNDYVQISKIPKYKHQITNKFGISFKLAFQYSAAPNEIYLHRVSAASGGRFPKSLTVTPYWFVAISTQLLY